MIRLLGLSRMSILGQWLGAVPQRSAKSLMAYYSKDNYSGTTNEIQNKSITQELTSRYQEYLDGKTPQLHHACPNLNKVAVVGAGMAGLYSALLLKKLQPNIHIRIFEASDRVGGRVYTHWFSDEKNQYFEAGAMRLPSIDWQKPVFNLITYLNAKLPDFPINLVPYHYSCPSGNRIFVNKTRQKDGRIMSVDYANHHLNELGFPPEAGAKEGAQKILRDAINPVVEELRHDFVFALKKYDSMTLHFYLSNVLGWSPEKVNYAEVMSAQTNEFHNGLIDEVIQNSDFTNQVVTEWKTIENGMSRLPQAMGKVIGEESILLQAPVKSLRYLDGGRIEIGYSQSDQTVMQESFDAVVLAIPPSFVRMISPRPSWSVSLEQGLRSINFQPVYKIGLRFKSRFWEEERLRASKGGQSITDLPCRWVVYPSYGIGDKEKGVLVLYSWMTDSSHWLSKSKMEKISLGLSDLQELYPEVDIAGQYAGGEEGDEEYLKEAFPVEWALQWPLGDATFYASQFSYLYPVMRQPQGQIYFTGEHLSVYHRWIVGAFDSARYTVCQLLGENVGHL